MKIVATADLHGHFPEIPDCDVLVVAGDILGGDNRRDYLKLHRWLRDLHERGIIVLAVGGNSDLWPSNPHELAWFLLSDESVTVQGVEFYGRPWASKVPIPVEPDVVICHEPPRREDVHNPLVLYGHVHFGGPRFKHGESEHRNVSCRQGSRIIKPFVIEL